MTYRRPLPLVSPAIARRNAWHWFHNDKMDTVDIAHALGCTEAEAVRYLSQAREMRQLAWRSA